MVRCKDTVRESARGLTLLCMTPFRRKTLLAARTPERLRAPLCTEPCLSADPACCRTPERLRALLCTEPCLSADPACRRALDRPRTRIRVPNPALALRRRDPCLNPTRFDATATARPSSAPSPPFPPPSEPPIKPVEPKFGVDNPLFTGAGLVTRPLIPGVVTIAGRSRYTPTLVEPEEGRGVDVLLLLYQTV